MTQTFQRKEGSPVPVPWGPAQARIPYPLHTSASQSRGRNAWVRTCSGRPTPRQAQRLSLRFFCTVPLPLKARSMPCSQTVPVPCSLPKQRLASRI